MGDLPVRPADTIVRGDAGGRDEDVDAVAAEVDVLAGDLPGALLAGGAAQEVRVGTAGGRPDEPVAALDASGKSSLLEGGQAVPVEWTSTSTTSTPEAAPVGIPMLASGSASTTI